MKCPRCDKRVFDENNIREFSISRKDNETKICNPCGTEEAFKDMPK